MTHCDTLSEYLRVLLPRNALNLQGLDGSVLPGLPGVLPGEHHTLRIVAYYYFALQDGRIGKVLNSQEICQSMSNNQSLDTAQGFGRDVSFLTSRLPAEAEAVDWEAALKRSDMDRFLEIVAQKPDTQDIFQQV